MKPVSRKIRGSSTYLQPITPLPVVAKIQGSVKKLGGVYGDAVVILYNKSNLQPIGVRKVNDNGEFLFPALNTELKCFAICDPQDPEYNALIFNNLDPS